MWYVRFEACDYINNALQMLLQMRKPARVWFILRRLISFDFICFFLFSFSHLLSAA